MSDYPPVEVGDTITITVREDGEIKPIKVRATGIAGPKLTPDAVVYRQVNGPFEGHIKYDQWQRAAAAQLAIAAAKGPVGPDDPGETEKLYAALDAIGKLTTTVARLEQIGVSFSGSKVILQAGQDMRTIRLIIKDITGKEYPAKEF